MTRILLFISIGPELLVILLVVVLLFGREKIPEIARATGETIGEFKKGVDEGEPITNPPIDEQTDQNETEEQNNSEENEFEFEQPLKNNRD